MLFVFLFLLLLLILTIIFAETKYFIIVRVINFVLSVCYTTVLRLFVHNIKLGQSVRIYYKSRVFNMSAGGGIFIGANSKIGTSSIQNHVGMPFYTRLLCDGSKSYIYIGDGCRINGAYIHAKECIKIGRNCVVASGVNIIDSNGHEVYSLDRTVGTDTPMPINIGNNVWIGVNTIVLKGTNIGDNCVVAAGSVVKGVYPPNSIIQGNPAIVVKSLNIDLAKDDTIDEKLKN